MQKCITAVFVVYNIVKGVGEGRGQYCGKLI